MGLESENDYLREQLDKEVMSKNNAYNERNTLVAFLSMLFPSHIKFHPTEDVEWEGDWRTIICIHSPMGQLTWHIHDSQAGMFEHLNIKPDILPNCEWDGHTTEEKYKRLLNYNNNLPGRSI